MSGYIKVLLKEFYADLANEIIDCYQLTKTNDDMLEKIVGYREGPEYEYED